MMSVLWGKADLCAAAVQGRPHPRQRHEAGGQPELRDRRVSAGHQDQDQPDRFCPARAASDDALQGRELGIVRADHEWREEQLGGLSNSSS